MIYEQRCTSYTIENFEFCEIRLSVCVSWFSLSFSLTTKNNEKKLSNSEIDQNTSFANLPIAKFVHNKLYYSRFEVLRNCSEYLSLEKIRYIHKNRSFHNLYHHMYSFWNPLKSLRRNLKNFLETCNVLPFSCTHLALWRSKAR